METYINMIITGSIWIVVALFFWKVYPLIKDNAIYKKALELVHLMEEGIGAGNGELKFDTAVSLLQQWIDQRGWKIDIQVIANAVTAAVGALHTEQGKLPVPKEKIDESDETDNG